MSALAAAAEPSRGWGGPIAIVVALGVFGVIYMVMERLEELRSPSPPPRPSRVSDENPLLNEGSEPDEPSGVVDRGAYIIDYGDGGHRTNVRVRKAGPADNLEDWVRANDGRMRTADLIRHAQAGWRVSESTVKRVLRRVRASE